MIHRIRLKPAAVLLAAALLAVAIPVVEAPLAVANQCSTTPALGELVQCTTPGVTLITVPQGAQRMSFVAIGGGGGGGTGSPGRAGGDGAYVEAVVDLSKIGATQLLVTVAGGGQQAGGSGAGGSSGSGTPGVYGTFGSGGAGGDVSGTNQASGGGMSAITNWTNKSNSDSPTTADLVAIAGGGGGGSTTSSGADGAAQGTSAGGDNDPGIWRAADTFTVAVGGSEVGGLGAGGAGGTAGVETSGLAGINFDPEGTRVWGDGGDGNSNSFGGAGGAGFGGGGSGQTQDGGAAGGSFVNNNVVQIVGTPTFRPSSSSDGAGAGGAKDASGQNGKVEMRFFTYPGEPQNVSGSVGDEQVTVSWQAPGSDGGSPITEYSVATLIDVGGQSIPAPQLCTTTGALSCVVTGLTNGETYRFEVTATNLAGIGNPSQLSSAVVPAAVPTPPSLLTAEPRNQAIELQWDDGSAAGGSILDYEYTTDGGTNWASVGALGPTAVVNTQSDGTNFTNGTAYSVALRTVATGGTSGPSASANVTPGTPRSPSTATASIEDGRAEIAWADSIDNGSPVQEYRVVVTQTATRSGALRAVRSGPGTYTTPTNSIVVSGLDNAGTYSFAISGRNVNGWGPTLVITRGSSGVESAQNLPPEWHQSIGRASADDACPSGWSPSWAQWMNNGTGGFVCNRVMFWDTSIGGWSMRSAALSVLG